MKVSQFQLLSLKIGVLWVLFQVSSMRRKPFLRTIITYERTINNAPAAQQVALHKWQPNTSDGHGMPFLFQMENQREDPLVGHSCACSRDLFVHLLKIGNFKH